MGLSLPQGRPESTEYPMECSGTRLDASYAWESLVDRGRLAVEPRATKERMETAEWRIDDGAESR